MMKDGNPTKKDCFVSKNESQLPIEEQDAKLDWVVCCCAIVRLPTRSCRGTRGAHEKETEPSPWSTRPVLKSIHEKLTEEREEK